MVGMHQQQQQVACISRSNIISRSSRSSNFDTEAYSRALLWLQGETFLSFRQPAGQPS